MATIGHRRGGWRGRYGALRCRVTGNQSPYWQATPRRLCVIRATIELGILEAGVGNQTNRNGRLDAARSYEDDR
jgi:hypothetical protein